MDRASEDQRGRSGGTRGQRTETNGARHGSRLVLVDGCLPRPNPPRLFAGLPAGRESATYLADVTNAASQLVASQAYPGTTREAKIPSAKLYSKACRKSHPGGSN